MSGTLKKINGRDIAKIASGQVIVDLRSVVKELIENSLVINLLSLIKGRMRKQRILKSILLTMELI